MQTGLDGYTIYLTDLETHWCAGTFMSTLPVFGVGMSRIWFALVAAAVSFSVLVAIPSAGSAASTSDSYGLVDPSTGIWHLYENGAEATWFCFKTDADTVEAVDSLVEFAKCMRAAGFDMPDPDASGQFPEFNKDNAEFDAAYEQCVDMVAGSKGSK
jgi:hypothetical protein